MQLQQLKQEVVLQALYQPASQAMVQKLDEQLNMNQAQGAAHGRHTCKNAAPHPEAEASGAALEVLPTVLALSAVWV